MIYLVRRSKLGRTSCREIMKNSQTGIAVYRNDQPLPQAELVFRWGCTSDVPSNKVVNTSEAIHRVNDKTAFRLVLDQDELCPKTWRVTDADVTNHLPVIIRPHVHAQGRKLYLCKTVDEFIDARLKVGPAGYASAVIDKVAEYRVFVVSGRAVCVASKTPANPQAIAWNAAQGGKFENVKWDAWPLKAVRVAIEAFKLSGLDFGGVDVMVDREGEVYVLEINSAPSLTSPYRQQCFAKAFDYIVRHGKDSIPLIEAKGGYLKFIHPAIHEGALLV